ncbi:MAG: putative LPS assembly protein LptD [Bernardetiaceae bacterium]
MAKGDAVWGQTDTLALSDSIPIDPSFTAVVDYQANDSIRFDVRQQTVFLFGESVIDYGDIKLTSEYISLDWQNNVLNANGKRNEKGQLEGTPIFEQGSDPPYKAEEITYNFVTRKAIVKQIKTEQNEGFVISERSKKISNDTYFAFGSLYTTCNLDHPHFGIRAQRIKMINKKQIVSGPFQLVINDIPTPIGFPFAIVPMPKTRASGIIIPTYGETRENGFFLRDGGFYWAASEYIDLAFLGEIHTRGRYGGRLQSRYKKRYAFDGTLEIRFNNRNSGERGTPEFSQERDFWFAWGHTPIPRGNSRFSANVNAGTSSFNRNNSFNPNDYLSTSFQSNISYSTRIGKDINLQASLRHNQNVETEVIKVTPQVSLGVNRLQPFKDLIPTAKRSLAPIRDLGFTYNFATKTDLTNALNPGSVPFKTLNPLGERDTIGFNFANAQRILQNADLGAQHRASLSTSMTLLRHFNLSPSFNYTENWYVEKFNYRYVGNEFVDVDTIPGFARAFSYSTSVGLSTRLYGFYFFKGRNSRSTIRHLMTPNVSFNYNPDFQDPRFGFFQEVQVSDDPEDVRRAVLLRGAYAVPGGLQSGSISFSLNNQLEMKRERVGSDEAKKITILDNFGVSTSYNLAADSLNLQLISMNARTTLFGKININGSANLDPYIYLAQRDPETDRLISQTRVNTFAWEVGQGLGQITQASIAISTNLNPQAFKPKVPRDKKDADQVAYINANRDLYVDFDVPWTLNLNYNLSYSRLGFTDPIVTQTINFSGDLSLTPKWKIGFRSGYDFERKELSFTSIDINRELHCWRMSVNWIPFGPRQSYSFEIGVQSSILSDLKLQRRNNWRDRL